MPLTELGKKVMSYVLENASGTEIKGEMQGDIKCQGEGVRALRANACFDKESLMMMVEVTAL